MGSTEKPSPWTPICPYQSPVPFPQRVVWSKLLMSKPRFTRFLDTLKRIYISVPFLEAVKEAPIYLIFLRELLSKKEKPREASLLLIEEA